MGLELAIVTPALLALLLLVAAAGADQLGEERRDGGGGGRGQSRVAPSGPVGCRRRCDVGGPGQPGGRGGELPGPGRPGGR